MKYFNIEKAKRAGMTDTQISEYLDKSGLRESTINHYSSVTPTQQPVQQEQQIEQGTGNAVFDLLLGVVNPIKNATVNTGKRIGEAGYQISRVATDPIFRKAVLGGELTEGEMGYLSQQPVGRFMSDEQLASPAKILSDTSKDAAILASLAVPGGTLAKSVASGAAYGYGASKDGNELLDTVLGAAGAGVGYGALKGIGKMAGVARGGAERAERALANPIVKASPYGAGEEKAIVAGLKKMDLLGDPKKVYEKLEPKMMELSTQIADNLAKRNKSIKTSKVFDILNDSFENTVNIDITDPIQQKAINKYTSQLIKQANQSGKNGLTISAQELFKYKQNLGNQLSAAFKKLDNNVPLTDKEEIAMKLWESLDDIITSVNPEVKALTSLQSILYKAAPGLQKKSNEKFSATLLGTNLPSGIAGNVARGTQNVMAKGLNKTANVLENPMIQKILSSSKDVSGLTGGALTSSLLNTSLGQTQPTQTGATEMPVQTPMQETQPPVAEKMSGTMVITPEMLMEARAVLSDSQFKKIQDIYDLQQNKGKQLPAGSVKDIADTEIAIELMGSLEQKLPQYLSVVGPIKGNLYKRNPYSKEAGAYNALLMQVKQIIGKGLEGGVLRKEDEYKYEQILPMITDTAERIQDKMQLLNETLQQKKNITNQTYLKYGYSAGSSNSSEDTNLLNSLLNVGQTR